MTDIIEMNSLAADAMTRDLRVGDRVEAMFDEHLHGTIIAITEAAGPVIAQAERHGITVTDPPTIRVKFDNGVDIDFQPVFLRSVVWRWSCLDVKRIGNVNKTAERMT